MHSESTPYQTCQKCSKWGLFRGLLRKGIRDELKWECKHILGEYLSASVDTSEGMADNELSNSLDWCPNYAMYRLQVTTKHGC